jgi:hypothetical protein
MYRWLLLCTVLLGMTACVTAPQPYLRAPDRADLNQQKDHLECMAQAALVVQGAGGFTSVAPVQAAFYDHAKQQAYVGCLETRGYSWAYR